MKFANTIANTILKKYKWSKFGGKNCALLHSCPTNTQEQGKDSKLPDSLVSAINGTGFFKEETPAMAHSSFIEQALKNIENQNLMQELTDFFLKNPHPSSMTKALKRITEHNNNNPKQVDKIEAGRNSANYSGHTR